MTSMLTGAGFTIINWDAKFVDSHTVQIGDKCVTAENIVIYTGRRANVDGYYLGLPNTGRWFNRNGCSNASQ